MDEKSTSSGSISKILRKYGSHANEGEKETGIGGAFGLGSQVEGEFVGFKGCAQMQSKDA